MRQFAMAVCALATLMAGPAIAPGHAAALARNAQGGTQRQSPTAEQTFTGTITKSGDNFLLNDAEKKASYTLDDVEQAIKYVGKKVIVTGTLDAQNHMIHVEMIQEAS